MTDSAPLALFTSPLSLAREAVAPSPQPVRKCSFSSFGTGEGFAMLR